MGINGEPIPERLHPELVAFDSEVSQAMSPTPRADVGPEGNIVAPLDSSFDLTAEARQRVEDAIDSAPPRTRDQL